MNIAVVGAGWAGLSAALTLHQHGQQVTVFESAHQLGGRARSVHSPKLNSTLDNGQHIMLGAYTQTLRIMRDLGLPIDRLLLSMPLDLHSADGRFRLRVPQVPAPLALPAALLLARGLSLKERLRLAILLNRLKQRRWDVSPKLTVARWLQQSAQSPHVVRSFWEPLCLAALNTPLHQACAQLFVNVLRDSLGAGPEACRVLIPRVDLSELWPNYLPPQITLLRGHPVRNIQLQSDHVNIDGRPFDSAIIATNVQPALRLLQQLPATQVAQQSYLDTLEAFEPIPIATLTLQLAGFWHLPHPMLMLKDEPQKGQFGQWLFHYNEFSGTPLPTSRLNVVISNAGALQQFHPHQIVQGVLTQIAEQAKAYPAIPDVTGYELITEKRATFAATPGLQRPLNTTPWPNVYTAGDWTDTDYPAVLEGAVLSGQQAALAALANLGTKEL